ncbi:MAG: hypothetical protein ACI9LO_000161 [Planctomycetota bacterium]|jgi:hypothetical protein
MGFNPQFLFFLVIASITANAPAWAQPGLATRNLNPILLPFYLPAYSSPSIDNKWQISHSFYITNNFSVEESDDEMLIIDVENYRYVFDLSYRRENWVLQASLPLMFSRGGEFDTAIEEWHKFFGLPGGGRGAYDKNQIAIEYQKNGVTHYSQKSPGNAPGDLSFALGYFPVKSQTGFYIGVELPTGSASDFSGNEAIDSATWVTHRQKINAKAQWQGLVGISFPGNGEVLDGLISNQILFAQLGIDHRFNEDLSVMLQLDLHSATIKDSQLRAFGNSVQLQLGFKFDQLIEDQSVDLFFSEDILVGSAPDIGIGLRLSQEF